MNIWSDETVLSKIEDVKRECVFESEAYFKLKGRLCENDKGEKSAGIIDQIL